MRIRSALAAAAVVLGFGLAAAAPASANPHFGPHFGHWGHWGHFGGFGIVDYGYADEDGCIRWRPTYDRFGNYAGRAPTNVCD